MHRSKKALFDHFVGGSEQQGRQLQAELPSSFLVHDKLKFGWGLNRQFGRIGTAHDSIDIGCRVCEKLVGLYPVRHETADQDGFFASRKRSWRSAGPSRSAPWNGSTHPGYSGGRALTSSNCPSSSWVSVSSTAARLS